MFRGTRLIKKRMDSASTTPFRNYGFDKKIPGALTKSRILESSSTPIISPSYPRGPYVFKNREYFIVAYETDPEALKKVVPRPLKPASNVVLYEWIKMPDSTGFGDYQESGTVIPCLLDGKPINYTAQMFLDCEPPIAAGREIWGFPKKYAEPEFKVVRDTIVGKLVYSGQTSALGTMSYKYKEINPDYAIASLTNPSCNLKLIPDVNFEPKIAQLIGYKLKDVKLKGAWEGPARLNLIPHATSPTADLPIRKVLGGKHYLADITLPYGEVLYDYIKNKDSHVDDPDPNVLSEKKILESGIMPLMSPSYNKGPILLGERTHFSIIYHSDPDLIREYVPDNVFVNDKGTLIAQWTSTSGNQGLGNYNKMDWMVPVSDRNGQQFLFQLASFLDSSSPITLGREVYGQPQKYGHPKIEVIRDTLNATLQYSGMHVATATMPFKQRELALDKAYSFLMTPRLVLKFIPNVEGNADIAQLVSIRNRQVNISSAYEGSGRLYIQDHANAPLGDLPTHDIGGAYHIVCSEELVHGKVEFDYLKGK